jgi:hypothetical protein
VGIGVVCVFLLVASTCDAAPVVRISQQECRNGRCYVSFASGTTVGRMKDRTLLVLSCGHGWNRNESVKVELQEGGFAEEGKFLALDAERDIS